MKAANTAIKRERYEMPNIEDIIYKANKTQVYSKIDLMSAYEQIELLQNQDLFQDSGHIKESTSISDYFLV